MSKRKEFGDFQTPLSLAQRVTALVDALWGCPDRVVEPTAGVGTLLKAAHGQWETKAKYEGFEINADHVAQARSELPPEIQVQEGDFFALPWDQLLSAATDQRLLLLGNPPWVTNADLGALQSQNLPRKSNSLGLQGLEALTGKANFDIAEWMLLRLIESLPAPGALAMLCKTMTARKVLQRLWSSGCGRSQASLFLIDAKAEFEVSVDACLFFLTGENSKDLTATVYSKLSLDSPQRSFGLREGHLVSDLEDYQRHQVLETAEGDEESPYQWRSGLKHDAAKVMEFTLTPEGLRNGFGSLVALERDYLYPLLKSSDLGNGRTATRKMVLVPQSRPGEDTALIAEKAPRTWQYLLAHGERLDARRSSIYLKRPRFSIFGIGDYSFAPWKVAVSGLYKNLSFVVLPPSQGRPVMVDDTCYSLPCQSEVEARWLCELLSSAEARAYILSLVFLDSKRPLTREILQRLSIPKLAQFLGQTEALDAFTKKAAP